MVRVGALKVLAEYGLHDARPGWSVTRTATEGHLPAHQPHDSRSVRLFRRAGKVARHGGHPAVRTAELSDRQVRMVEQVFEDEIASVLAPLAVPAPDKFPPLANQVLVVGVRLKTAAGSRYVVIPFGGSTHRFLTLYSEGGYAYLLLEDAVSMFLDRMFPHEEVLECVPFRLTCHADAGVRQDLAGDLLSLLSPDAKQDRRKRLRATGNRRACQSGIPAVHPAGGDTSRTRTASSRIPGPLDLAAFAQLHDLLGFRKTQVRCLAAATLARSST